MTSRLKRISGRGTKRKVTKARWPWGNVHNGHHNKMPVWPFGKQPWKGVK